VRRENVRFALAIQSPYGEITAVYIHRVPRPESFAHEPNIPACHKNVPEYLEWTQNSVRISKMHFDYRKMYNELSFRWLILALSVCTTRVWDFLPVYKVYIYTCMCIFLPVDEFSADGAFEEAAAAVAGEDPVVLAAGRVAADQTRESRRASLHQRGRQAGVDGSRADRDGGGGTAPSCCSCCHGGLVEHHAVDHGCWQHGRRGTCRLGYSGRRRGCGIGERRDAVIGQVRVVMMMMMMRVTVERRWRRCWADLCIRRDRRVAASRRWRRWTFQTARRYRTDGRHAAAARP